MFEFIAADYERKVDDTLKWAVKRHVHVHDCSVNLHSIIGLHCMKSRRGRTVIQNHLPRTVQVPCLDNGWLLSGNASIVKTVPNKSCKSLTVATPMGQFEIKLTTY